MHCRFDNTAIPLNYARALDLGQGRSWVRIMSIWGEDLYLKGNLTPFLSKI